MSEPGNWPPAADLGTAAAATLAREKRSIRRLAFDRVNVDGAQPAHPQKPH